MVSPKSKTKAELLEDLAAAQSENRKLVRQLKRSERDVQRLMQVVEDGELQLRNRVTSVIAEAQQTAQPRARTWYSLPQVRERAQAAHARTQALFGGRSWSEFVEASVVRHTLELEDRYNDGKAFEAMSGVIRPGRSATNRLWGSQPHPSRKTTTTSVGE